MLRHDLGDLGTVVRERRPQVCCDREMKRLSFPPRQRLVGNRAQQRLGKRVLSTIRRQPVGSNAQDLLAHEFGEQRVDLVAVAVADGTDGSPRERATEDGQRLHERALRRREGVDPGRDERGQ